MARKYAPRTTPVPSNLAAAAGVTGVELSWAYTPSFDFTRFEVYRDGVFLTNKTTTSHVDTTATSGVTYAYTVRGVRTNPTSSVEYASALSASVNGSWSSDSSADIEIISIANSTSGPTVSWNAVTGATVYQLERSLDPLFFEAAGVTEVVEQAATSYQDTTAVAGTLSFYRVRADGGTPSSSRVGSKLGAGAGDTITLGTLTLTPNYEAIHINLAVTGDTARTARAVAEFSNGTTWRHAPVALRRQADAFIGAISELTSDTPYTVRVTVTNSGGVTGDAFKETPTDTRLDDQPTYAELLAAVTHYVDFATGDDSRSAATASVPETPWKTYDKAIQQANAGTITNATIRVSGYQPAAATQLTASNTRFVATNAATATAAGGRYAPRNDSTAHTVIYGRFTAPALSDLDGDAVSTTHGIYGKGGWTEYTPSGTSYTVWKSPALGITNPRQLHYTDATGYGTYAEAKAADPLRLVYWRKDNTASTASVTRWLNTLDEFCEWVHTNSTYRAGWYTTGTADSLDASYQRVYARFPNGINPNTCYVWVGRYQFTEASTVAALDVIGSGNVFAGFNVRALANGFRIRQGADDTVLLRNLTHGCGAHYVPFKNSDGTGAKRVTIQDFRMTDTELWHEDEDRIPWMIVKQKARDANGNEYAFDPPTDESETTGVKFNTAGRQYVIRRFDCIGPFNGLGATGSSTAPAAQRDVHIHDGYLSEIADNCIEPEGYSTSWVIHDLQIENVRNFISTSSIGAAHLLYRCRIWRWGNHGIAPDVIGATTDASKGGTGQLIKMGAGTVGGTMNPLWALINITAWCNVTGSKLWAKAIGQSSVETFYNRNNIFRAPGWLADNTPATPTWDNNYNLWGGEACELHGVDYNSTDVTGDNSLAAARTAGVMGANDNKHGGTDANLVAGGVALIDSLMTDEATGTLALTTASSGRPIPNLSDSGATPSRGYEG